MVTMKWWTDLWLNEAFATIAAYYCYHHLIEEGKVPYEPVSAKLNSAESPCWLHFCKEKRKACIDDVKPTTHPI